MMMNDAAIQNWCSHFSLAPSYANHQGSHLKNKNWQALNAAQIKISVTFGIEVGDWWSPSLFIWSFCPLLILWRWRCSLVTCRFLYVSSTAPSLHLRTWSRTNYRPSYPYTHGPQARLVLVYIEILASWLLLPAIPKTFFSAVVLFIFPVAVHVDYASALPFVPWWARFFCLYI